LAVDDSEALARIALPILVLTASRDLVIPHAATRWIMETAQNACLIVIDGPHLLLQTCPEECAAAVMHFVRTLPLCAPAAE
jgi:pimeloyl-ACP methyl ester carboxylesterase